MFKLRIDAPAKLNLHLRVFGRRPDGFHDLESIFIALDFGDRLCFEPLPEDNALKIRMKGGAAAVPMGKNIIFRAVSLFRRRVGCSQGLVVSVDKRIPLGGGLGGGSSDAASTLLALNALSGGGASEDSLAEMAASLGSDVPFFLTPGGAAWAGGRGEQIRPLEAPANLWFVLANPGFFSETAAAFRLLDQCRPNPEHREYPPPSALVRALAGPPRNWPFTNDFLPVLERDQQAYRKILDRFAGLGADFCGLSGSGSTCFGVFIDRKKAEKAAKILSEHTNFVKITFPLARRAITVLE